MAYLGNAPARSFISFERQVFTIVNSQTAYTLDHSVTNENDIRLVINNIVQEPGSGKAYTASGTTLTLSAALTNGTDEMYCVFLGRAVATNKPGAGSVGTTELAADAVTGAKIADDAISDEHLDPTAITGQSAETSIATDDLILLSDTSASGALKKMTRANFVSGIGGTNTPAFEATRSSNQTITHDTMTKITCNVETFDTAGNYDNSTNYRFTPTTAGKYYIYTQATASIGIEQLNRYSLIIRKNGSNYKVSSKYFNNNPARIITSFIGAVIDFNGSSDYVELFTKIEYASSGTIEINGDSTELTFGGYKIIE